MSELPDPRLVTHYRDGPRIDISNRVTIGRSGVSEAPAPIVGVGVVRRGLGGFPQRSLDQSWHSVSSSPGFTYWPLPVPRNCCTAAYHGIPARGGLAFWPATIPRPGQRGPGASVDRRGRG